MVQRQELALDEDQLQVPPPVHLRPRLHRDGPVLAAGVIPSGLGDAMM